MTLSLAQQYEQDKQRLVQTCFSKYEADGLLHELYITHVRIVEDLHYPSSRPPPNSSSSHKKTRILALAVKKSGTVRLHKGRENPNGLFQIGRTWTLDELTEINIDIATECGLLVTLGKPYYWETNTSKERTVFIKSMCNIYHKFTRGGLPVLTNFDRRIFADIIALGNHGRPPTLRYNDMPETSPRVSTSNLTYGESRRSAATNTLLPVTPVNGTNGLPSPISLRENSYIALSGRHLATNTTPASILNHQSQAPLIASRQSSTSLRTANLPVMPKSQPIPMPVPQAIPQAQPKHHATPKQSPQAQAQPSRTQGSSSVFSTQTQGQAAYVQNQYPPLNQFAPQPQSHYQYLSQSHNHLQSQSQSSRTQASSSQILSSRSQSTLSVPQQASQSPSLPLERSALKSELLDLPELTTVPLNRSSVLSVEFKSTLPRASLEIADDSAVVMSEIYKQRLLNKKPSMRMRRSNTNLRAEAEPAPPTPVIVRLSTTESTEMISEDPEAKGTFDDNVVEERIEKKRHSMRKNEATLEELLEEIEWSSRDDSKTLTQKLTQNLLRTEYESINLLINILSNFLEIDRYIEESIAQCEKLDPMLTFFQVELDGFSDEIAYIERQGSGLQVTTANKKILWNELKDILSNVSLSQEELSVLTKYQILRDENNIKIIENVMKGLYQALRTIRGGGASDLGQMRALTERNKVYEKYSHNFLLGFQNTLSNEFNGLSGDISRLVKNALTSTKNGALEVSVLMDTVNKELAQLLVYAGIVLYAKEIAEPRFLALLEAYQKYMKRAYTTMTENLLKFNAHVLNKILGSVQYLFLFDYREIRTNVVGKDSQATNIFDLGLCEVVFDKIRSLVIVLQDSIIQQQNFIALFFHVLLVADMDLNEYLHRFQEPQERISAFLNKNLVNELKQDHDDSIECKAAQSIDRVFTDVIGSIVKFLTEFGNKNLQILPLVILLIDSNVTKLASENNDFIIQMFLKKLLNRFKNIWYNYNQAQGKVFVNSLNLGLQIEKKMNLLYVTKAYVQLIKFIERSLRLANLSSHDVENSSIRLILDTTYEDYNRSILSALSACLSQITGGSPILKNRRSTRSSVQPRVKRTQEEQHTGICVNIIVNSNYLVDSFERYDLITVNEFRTKLTDDILKGAKLHYIETLLQSSLSKLIDFVEGIEALLTNKNMGSDLTKNSAYSKENFRQLMVYYDKQEVFKGVQNNYKRVETDFAYYGSTSSLNDEEIQILHVKEKDVEHIQNKLVSLVWSQLETEYILTYKRLEGIINKYYRDVEVEVTRNTLVQMFNAVKSGNDFH